MNDKDYSYDKSEENNQLAIEFEIVVRKNEKTYKDLNYFVNEDIELASPNEALDANGELVIKKDSLEYNFKSKRLGSLLKPLELIYEDEKEEVYKFSKFWVDDNESLFSSARINDYIVNNFTQFPLLVNVLNGEITLYKRGKQALNDIRRGEVKNPGIIGYLLNIEYSNDKERLIDKEEIIWSNNNLDEFQKESVYRAINSNSIFLLQGPPGTGKTQTITEMVYQFNKMNKKVLLSSQTHIAIDNVLERLPDELNILPIRLINSERIQKTKNNFLPDKIMDNFYEKIISKYQKENDKFINFNKEIENKIKEYQMIEDLVNKYRDSREIYNDLNIKLANKKDELTTNTQIVLDMIEENKNIESNINFIDEFTSNDYKIKEYNYANFSIEMIIGFDKLIKDHKVEKLYKIDQSSLNEYFKIFENYFSDNEKF